MTKVKKVAKQKVVAELSGLSLIGEIIAWRPGSGDRTLTNIRKALRETGLDETVAKDLSAETAFARAVKNLDAIVDPVRSDADEVVYQFTGKKLTSDGKDEQEWRFEKQCYVTLRKLASDVSCKDKSLEAKVSELVKSALEARNGSDVTTIVQRLIDSQPSMDLFAIRDQGGAYFVFAQHADFIGKLDDFLQRIGGKVNRFPVPRGTQIGDSAVQDTVSEGLGQLIAQHDQAVEAFSVSTRADTIEATAERINITRTKIEAYAMWLGDRKDELLKAVEESSGRLTKRVGKLSGEKEAMPVQEKTGNQRINEVLSPAVPKTLEQISKESGIRLERVKVHVKYLIKKKGWVAQKEDGFIWTKNGVKV